MSTAAEAASIGASILSRANAPGGWLARSVMLLRALGPYAAIELLLPGGSLLALTLWLYRRYRRGRSASARQLGEEPGELVEIERLHQVRVEAGLA